MKEIKENEYVRLRNGDVTRVKAINEKTFKCKFHKVNCELFIDYIVKHKRLNTSRRYNYLYNKL